MRAGAIICPIVFAIMCRAIFQTFSIYGFQVKTYFLLSHIGLFLTAFHYLNGSLKFLKLVDLSITLDDSHKLVFCYNFMTAALYWLLRVYDSAYVWDGYQKPGFYVFFLHGGTLIILVIEHFLWKRHYPSTNFDLQFMCFFALAIVGLLYCCHFFFGVTVYPFLKYFNEFEFALYPILMILLLFLALKTHLLMVVQFKGTEESAKWFY